MSLLSLQITDFRCLASVSLDLHPGTNLIVGPNASGKTSFLEAIYFLGRGRSFRSVRTGGLIRDGQSAFTLSAALDGLPKKLGVRGEGAGLTIRVDGQTAKGLAHLASALPVQVIEPGIHRLIEAGPAERRAFLDWGVFHVKQSFLEEWRRYQRALKQRNAVLRTDPNRDAAMAWEDALFAAGDAVHKLRLAYVQELAPIVGKLGLALLNEKVELVYRAGWDESLSLPDAVAKSWSRDTRMGITHVGPHRADLTLRMADRAARARVSRGQQKLLASGLVLAQMHLFHQARDEHPVLLLDDPAAELDTQSLNRLFEVIEQVPAQRFVTGLFEAQMRRDTDHALFHVEQGKLQKVVY